MSGYIYNIRLWRRKLNSLTTDAELTSVSGPFLEARARDRRRALSMGEIETRLCQIDHFLEAVEHLLDGCPEDLQLDWRRYARDRKGLTTSASVAYESMRSMVDRVSVVEGFVSETPPTFESRPSVRTNLRRQCFLAHQANLYVTQVCMLSISSGLCSMVSKCYFSWVSSTSRRSWLPPTQFQTLLCLTSTCIETTAISPGTRWLFSTTCYKFSSLCPSNLWVRACAVHSVARKALI